MVYEELRALMGGQQAELVQPKYGPAVILMAGLQVGRCALVQPSRLPFGSRSGYALAQHFRLCFGSALPCSLLAGVPCGRAA